MFNKKIILVLVLIMVLSLAACQMVTETSASNDQTTDTQTTTAQMASEESSEQTDQSSGETSTAAATPSEGYSPGKLAYDFELEDLEGNSHVLSDYRGKVLVVNFFASWCPPCQAEAPYINDAYLDLKDSDVVLLGVNLIDQDTMDDLKAFIAENDLAFPVMLDEGSEVAKLYRVSSIPTTVFISPNGVISERHIGILNKEQFIELAEKAMSEGE